MVPKLHITNFRVEIDPRQLLADEFDQARKIGKSHNASIVIWGEDTGVEVIVNYLNLKEPSFDAAEVRISETEFTQLAMPKSYGKFVTHDLPQQLTFLSLFTIGQSLAIEGKFRQAIEVIEKAIGTLPSDRKMVSEKEAAYNRLGWLYQILGNAERAIYIYSEIIELNPSSVLSYINRGLAYFDFGKLDEAKIDFKKSITLNSEDVDAYLNLGLVYFWEGDLDNAIEMYSKAISLNPNYTFAYVNRGNARDDKSDLYGAIADYTIAIQINPNLFEAYYNRAITRKRSKDYDRAITDLTKALELNPDNILIYDARGSSYAEIGNINDAIKDFTKAIDIFPGINYSQQYSRNIILNSIEPLHLAIVYKNRSAAYLERGDTEKAIFDLTKVIELYPDLVNTLKLNHKWSSAANRKFPIDIIIVYCQRANAYQKVRRFKEAIEDYSKAIDLHIELTKNHWQEFFVDKNANPAKVIDAFLADAYSKRGLVRRQNHDPQGALEDYSKAIDINPYNSDYYNFRGNVKLDAGDLSGAILDFTKSIELSPRLLILHQHVMLDSCDKIL